jgi:hypothetical protein
MRENYWYFTLKANLNTISPSFDFEKERIRENRKRVVNQLNSKFNEIKRKAERQKYLEENKEQIINHKKEVRKIYNENNRDVINARMREYNQKTKERRAELAKKYYKKRKENGYYLNK